MTSDATDPVVITATDRSDALVTRLVAAAEGVVGSARVRVGVAGVHAFDDVRTEIERRDASGERGDLGFVYRDPEIATEPLRSFPWATSIVVAAVGYLRPGDGLDGDRPDGRGHDRGDRSVARFADGDRYRDLRSVLTAIGAELASAGHRAEPIADDDRLVDRAVAVRAGIAWWGKSTMALAPGMGPWFLIGSVVTDAALPATPPMERSCGTCTACIPACPTGAIVAPGILDARRCLAALFQGRGAIPRDLRHAAGGRIYGCDDCLTACPPGHPSLADLPAGPTPTPEQVLGRSDEELLADHGHWYIPGRRVRFIRRNALVAAGNSGSEDLVPLLAGYLGHPDPLLREHAAWAIGAIGGDRAEAVLAVAARLEQDPAVGEEIAMALVGPTIAP